MNNSKEIEIALLGFLYSQPMHGYELYKEISNLSGVGLVWRIKMSNLYAMLRRLEMNGWVTAKTAQEGNRPLRNLFQITAEGRRKFDKWLVAPVNKGRDFRIVFLLKMYFSVEMGEGDLRRLISEQKAACAEWLEQVPDTSSISEKALDFRRIVWEFRSTQINGYLDWLSWCQNHIIVEEK